MSAIFGIIDLKGQPIEKGWIAQMQQDLEHRGPDGKGLYEDGPVMMGHMLLQVTPESIYEQSPLMEDGLVITSDARLDERDTLMDRLQIEAADRYKITDTILLLRSYKKWGKDFVKDIYGDFAFAIWDKEKKELFCARDHMGIKRLLYYVDENYFVFATEIKPIVKLPFVNTQINPENLRDRALSIAGQLEKTIWINITRLKPANSLHFANKKIGLNQYWKPVYKRNKKFKTAEQSAAALKKILEKVIADHTRVIGNVGAPLSGGLDSSTVACLAARKLKREEKNLITVSSVYNIGTNNPDFADEQEYIAEVVNQEPNILPQYVNYAQHKIQPSLNNSFQKHYVPVNGFFYVDEALYEQFQFKSVRRVLSGLLGDLTVSNALINPIPILITGGRFRALKKFMIQYEAAEQKSAIPFLKHSILNELAPIRFRKWWNSFKNREEDHSRNLNLLPYQLSASELKILQKKLDNSFSFPNFSAKNVSNSIWPQHFNIFDEDWDCGPSHHQLEITYPLVDRRVVELLLQIPVEHFYANGLRRGLIRAAMQGVLPEKIRLRRTKGTYSPGYAPLYQQEIPAIVALLNEEPLSKEISRIIEVKKLIFALENLPKSVNDDTFGFINWMLIELIIVAYFDKWISNTKHKNTDEKANKEKME